MLPELLQGAQTNHGPTTEPERSHGPKLLMQTDEELVQTASVHDVLQVPVPERAERNNTGVGAFCHFRTVLVLYLCVLKF